LLDEQIARSDKTILAKDRLLELRWSELQHLTAEVLLRDELIEAKDRRIEQLTREVEAKHN
jgi:hypothetical protein